MTTCMNEKCLHEKYRYGNACTQIYAWAKQNVGPDLNAPFHE